MTKDMQAIKDMLQRKAACTYSDDEMLCEGNDKLARILQKEYDDSEKTAVEYINSFMTADEVQKRKVLSYCVDFFDPTFRATPPTQGEQICQHAFLQQDELYMLQQFVKRHQEDSLFGDVVYRIMADHGMTAPQVYKNAFLRRQDFSRVTDPRSKNVTRQIAWQIVMGLHCSLQEADEVLFSAGYIRRNNRFDLVMEYFVETENYDIMAINDVLDELKLRPFSCYLPVRDN